MAADIIRNQVREQQPSLFQFLGSYAKKKLEEVLQLSIQQFRKSSMIGNKENGGKYNNKSERSDSLEPSIAKLPATSSSRDSGSDTLLQSESSEISDCLLTDLALHLETLQIYFSIHIYASRTDDSTSDPAMLDPSFKPFSRIVWSEVNSALENEHKQIELKSEPELKYNCYQICSLFFRSPVTATCNGFDIITSNIEISKVDDQVVSKIMNMVCAICNEMYDLTVTVARIVALYRPQVSCNAEIEMVIESPNALKYELFSDTGPRKVQKQNVRILISNLLVLHMEFIESLAQLKSGVCAKIDFHGKLSVEIAKMMTTMPRPPTTSTPCLPFLRSARSNSVRKRISASARSRRSSVTRK
jgi:hypothetical protein